MRYYCIEFNPNKKPHTMARKNLETNINIRLHLDDIIVLKEQADRLRVQVSTYCRTKLTQDIPRWWHKIKGGTCQLNQCFFGEHLIP